MRILITGGAGFIGSHTVVAALSVEHKVRMLGLRRLGWTPRVDLHAGLSELLTGASAAAQELVQVPC